LIIIIILGEEYKSRSSHCAVPSTPPSRQFIPLRPKHSPQHLVLKYSVCVPP
jgi:hypothetical protein